jgi:NodT family efflux transporter outer membrane factor (OMF) lipoprotein
MKSCLFSSMPRRLKATVLPLAIPVLLAACAVVGPEHEVPVVATGSGWTSPAQGHIDTATLATWWKSFGDADLERVVEQTLANNLDMRQADLAIEAARTKLGGVEVNTMPVVTAKGSAQRYRTSLNSPEYNPQRSLNQTVYDTGLDASWEIDLFGSLRRQRESAQAAVQMSEADAAALRTSLAAETARTYFTLRGAQRELLARRASAEALEDIFALVQKRQQAGDLPTTEVERAQARLDQARALLPDIEARREAAAIALGLLTGGLPESQRSLTASPGIDLVLHAIPVGERADILRRRPDIASAERKLAAATADTGAATAELFPKLTISASAGFRALSDFDLIDSDSRRSSLLPLISWRLFDGGRVRAEIRTAEARQKSAAIGYEKAVLAALSDAEKALSQYQHALQTVAAQEAAIAGTARVAKTTHRRYELGDVSLADALDADRELADQQAELALSRASAASDMVTLYKALGGGWKKASGPSVHSN